jgi:hypothetical protein
MNKPADHASVLREIRLHATPELRAALDHALSAMDDARRLAELVEAAENVLDGVGPYFVEGTNGVRIREIRITDDDLTKLRAALAAMAQDGGEG